MGNNPLSIIACHGMMPTMMTKLHARFNLFGSFFLCLCILCPAPAALAAAPTWSSGGYLSTGSYGNPENTHILAVPLGVKWRVDAWTFKVNTAWVRIAGPGTVSADKTDPNKIGGVVDGKSQGLGDSFLSASFRLPARANVASELSARIKLPTGRAAKGLGTGAADYELRADGYWPLANTLLFAGTAYRWRGDTESVAFKNTASATFGLDAKISPSSHLGTYLSAGQASTARAAPSLDLNVYLTLRSTAHRDYALYALKGFRNGSPDLAAGVQISW